MDEQKRKKIKRGVRMIDKEVDVDLTYITAVGDKVIVSNDCDSRINLYISGDSQKGKGSTISITLHDARKISGMIESLFQLTKE